MEDCLDGSYERYGEHHGRHHQQNQADYSGHAHDDYLGWGLGVLLAEVARGEAKPLVRLTGA